MKRSSNWILVMLAAVVAIGLAGQANAFHDGGVAECSGCHSMHNGQASPLLVAQDKGSTCLSCHESPGDTGPRSYHISTAAVDMPNDEDPPLQRSPGGDFGWLRKDLSEPASYGGGYVFINNFGRENGHSIGAAANGYATEAGTAPGGGSFSAGDLTCTSCHDPHGQARITGTGAAPVIQYPTLGSTHDPIFDSGSYGAEPATGEAVGTYRLLYGAGNALAPSPVAYPGAPPAVVNSSYNRSEASTTTRVSYGYSATGTGDGFTSWGRWCGSCHPDMHTDLTSNLVHKVDDTLGSAIQTNYNNYVKTGDLSGVFPRGGPYTSLVPFALNTKSITDMAAKALVDDSDLSGPTASDRMTCMTCHRAHASAWKYALRWNGEAEFLTLGGAGAPVYPGTDAGLGNQGQFNRGYSVAQMEAAYYDRAANREFAAHQRSLCNKCHVKD